MGYEDGILLDRGKGWILCREVHLKFGASARRRSIIQGHATPLGHVVQVISGVAREKSYRKQVPFVIFGHDFCLHPRNGIEGIWCHYFIHL